MRILFCGINYAPDLIGVPKYNTELCEWLKDNGHDVRVITAPPYYPAWNEAAPAGSGMGISSMTGLCLVICLPFALLGGAVDQLRQMVLGSSGN
jgi:hypothetical protein